MDVGESLVSFLEGLDIADHVFTFAGEEEPHFGVINSIQSIAIKARCATFISPVLK